MSNRPDDDNTCEFQIGDHIYQWCSFAGIPAVFQHHGIVMDCSWNEDTDAATSECGGEWIVQIADFSNVDHSEGTATLPDGTTIDTSFTAPSTPPSSSSSSASNRKRSFGTASSKSITTGGGYQVRTYTTSLSSNTEKWHKVIYSANWWQRQVHRTGTCTGASSDPPGLVRARVQFLLDHQSHVLPQYDAVTANCECVAVWCKTGTWATLQAINWLVMTAAGQVKSAVTVGSIAAASQVTVPAAGFWGWMGYTTTVPLLSTQPYLLPAIIGYGVVTVAAPTLWLMHAKHHAKQTTEKLNMSFWEQAIDQPEIFVECITNWSALYEPNKGEDQYQILNGVATADHVNEEVVSEATRILDDKVAETESTESVKVVAPNVGNAPEHGTFIVETTNLQSTGQQSLEEAS